MSPKIVLRIDTGRAKGYLIGTNGFIIIGCALWGGKNNKY